MTTTATTNIEGIQVVYECNNVRSNPTPRLILERTSIAGTTNSTGAALQLQLYLD